MIPMKCTKSVVYAGKRLQPGIEFQARGEKDARVLAAIGKAERLTVAPVAPPATYSTRMMTAARAPAVAQAPAAEYVIKVDGADVVLDDMDYDALRALCDRLEVKPHALARETGMRKALVKSQAA